MKVSGENLRVDVINVDTNGERLSPPLASTDPTVGAIVTTKDRTEALLRGLVLVLRHHGAPDEISRQLETQLSGYLGKFLSEDDWVKRVKHVLTYPMAKYLGNEPPKTTGDDFSPKGGLKKWMKNRLSVFCRKNTHLWYSWFQAKRAALPMSDDFVDQTYNEHFLALIKEDDGDDATIDGIFEDPAFILVLKNIADSVAQSYRADSFPDLQPSTNASFEKSRKLGGQQNELLSEVDFDGDHFNEEDELFSPIVCELLGATLDEGAYECRAPTTVQDTDLFSMRWFPRGFFGNCTILNCVLETRERKGRDQWGRIRKCLETFVPDPRGLCCTIQAVLEPMKVRVISKGQALPYYSMKPLQKALWKSMKDMNCFRLIGRRFSPTDMMDLRMRASCTDEWFSIDYSAATDGLSWKYSGRILDAVISGLDQRDQEIARAVLGPHRLYYPKKGAEDGRAFRGTMRRGQLMGSVLSFPILCLANLGVYLYAMRENQAMWSIREQLDHVLVNGDDMLYAAPVQYWNEHIAVGKAVGLNMSVGKSYHHHTYANVNSTSVHHDIRDSRATPWSIDFLNVGLFFGQHKVQSKEETAASHHDDGATEGKCAVLPLLLQGCLPGRQSSILKMYLSLHKADIQRETRLECNIGKVVPWDSDGTFCGRRVMTRNLFLPISVGGMGVPSPAGFTYKVTLCQRLLGVLLYGEMGPFVTTQRPLPGYAIEQHVEVVARPWAVKDVVEVHSRKHFGKVFDNSFFEVGLEEFSPSSSAIRF